MSTTQRNRTQRLISYTLIATTLILVNLGFAPSPKDEHPSGYKLELIRMLKECRSQIPLNETYCTQIQNVLNRAN